METGTETLQSHCLSTLPSLFFFSVPFIFFLPLQFDDIVLLPCSPLDIRTNMPYYIKVLAGSQSFLRYNIPYSCLATCRVRCWVCLSLLSLCINPLSFPIIHPSSPSFSLFLFIYFFLLPVSLLLAVLLSLSLPLSPYVCHTTSFCILVIEHEQESPS